VFTGKKGQGKSSQGNKISNNAGGVFKAGGTDILKQGNIIKKFSLAI